MYVHERYKPPKLNQHLLKPPDFGRCWKVLVEMNGYSNILLIKSSSDVAHLLFDKHT